MSDFSKKDLISASARFAPAPPKEPKIDTLVSKIVGKKIYQRDPRLIKLIVKWRGNKGVDDMTPDDYFRSQKHIDELRAIMNKPL